MALGHYNNIKSHNENWEPIFKNLFEITFDLPEGLQRNSEDVKLLLENATSINLPTTPDLGKATQRFKYSTRIFVGLPEQTHVDDITIKFNANQNDKNAVFVWNILKAWYNAAWNQETGELGTKRELIGNIIVNQHNRKGDVIRRVTYKKVQIFGIDSQDLSWESPNEIMDITAKFVCDHYEDLYTDDAMGG
jgi:hypothetical protein